MADVFISYKRRDRTLAAAIDEALRQSGYTCWWDTSLVAGDHFNEAIERELAQARCVLVLWSRESHASQWVQAEAIDGFNRKVLVAARLDDVELKYPFGIVQTADLRGYRPGAAHTGLDELIAGVSAKVGRVAIAATDDGGERAKSVAPRTWPLTRNQTLSAVGVFLFLVACLVLGIRFITNTHPPNATVFRSQPYGGAGESARLQLSVQLIDASALSPGTEFNDCAGDTWCPRMIVIPSADFLIGSPRGEAGRIDDEGPQRSVTVPAFAASKFEITFSQWETCVLLQGCSTSPNDPGWGRESPVRPISYADAQEYVNWLRGVTGATYRLLTEAEWEYAARAGTSTPWFWGNNPDDGCSYANLWDRTADQNSTTSCRDGFGRQTAPVGSYRPNRFGLFDMLGNEQEWVEGCYSTSYSDFPTDGTAYIERGVPFCYRVVRGGSYRDPPRMLRAADRGRFYSDDQVGTLRVARALSL